MASAAVSAHVGGGALSLMSCVRESSPHESISDYDSEKNATSKKKFWNPRKWFKRKSNKVLDEIKPEPSEVVNIKEPTRSRSASELSETDEPVKRRSGTPMHPGLSVSHDSIFHSPHSGSELELEEAQSSSSLSIQHHPTQKELRLQTELSERLRLRRGHGDTSEDDEGLPRSPCCNSPTTMEGLNEKTPIKNHATKSHSTCSDGSLLSMGSSDIEEDSYGPHSSQHSSKVSLHEKKPPLEQESDWEFGATSVSTPLNHSAAHHRVSVRPKRTHGAPRRKRIQPVVTSSALPTTPEVNEDLSLRSTTPEGPKKESMTELYSSVSISETKTEIQLKCSSLPPGLAGPTSESGKLNRSRSSAGSKSQDALCEEDEDKGDKKTDGSIFTRLFIRRSAKKKKSQQEDITASCSVLPYTKHTTETSSPKLGDKKSVIIKSGPASRQRVLPLGIPATPEATHRELETLPDKIIVEPCLQITPLVSTSPQSKVDPQSPHFTSTSAMVWSENSTFVNNSFESRTEGIEVNAENSAKYESKSKVKIAGLSSLQQRVLLHNEDAVDNTFTSLTDFGRDDQTATTHITKSHSFRTNTSSSVISKSDLLIDSKIESSSIVKSSSFDSIKELDDPQELSIISDSSESLNSDMSAKTSSTEFLDSLNPCSSITISGPSHTSVVSISTLSDAQIKQEPAVFNTVKDTDVNEPPVTVTTIQLKRDLISNTKTVPEFLNVQLNKVDFKPTNNVVLTTPTKLPLESKNIFNFETPPKSPLRKFSQDDIEVIDKESNEEIIVVPFKNIASPNVIITAMTPPVSTRIFKKNTEVTTQTRKSSLVTVSSESKSKIILRTKSNSLDSDISVTNLDKTEIKQKTTSTIDLKEDVVMRRKSLAKEKHDDEPELMKVFARRSLKIKDGDEIAQQVLNMMQDTIAPTQDSDKENLGDQNNLIATELEKPKESLTETKFIETTEVTFRKPINNKFFAYQQRTVSLNVPKVNDINMEKMQKSAFSDRPKTQIGSKINDLETKVVNTDISSKSDFINEDFPTIPKNFNQRKAEWEKRAQEALKKTVP